MMFFTSAGRVYRLKCYEVPEGSRTYKGMNIVNLLPLAPEEKVTAMIRVSEFEGDRYLCMVTRARASSSAPGWTPIPMQKERPDCHRPGRRMNWPGCGLTDGYQRLIVATRLGMAIELR